MCCEANQLRVPKPGISSVLGGSREHLSEERTSGELRATSLRGEPVCSRNPDAGNTKMVLLLVQIGALTFWSSGK